LSGNIIPLFGGGQYNIRCILIQLEKCEWS